MLSAARAARRRGNDVRRGGRPGARADVAHHLEREFDKLKKSILHVAAMVEERVLDAMRSLQTRDRALARQVVESDAVIDELEVDFEEECLKVLALHQPVATDLRFIVAALKINNDLERIADLAVNLAERAANLAAGPPVAIPFDLEGMSRMTIDMLHRSIDALVYMDSRIARETRKLDDDVDRMTREAFEAVQESIRAKPEFLDPFIQFLSCARHLERIADLATNIAEDVIYLIEGEIVRHKPAVV